MLKTIGGLLATAALVVVVKLTPGRWLLVAGIIVSGILLYDSYYDTEIRHGRYRTSKDWVPFVFGAIVGAAGGKWQGLSLLLSLVSAIGGMALILLVVIAIYGLNGDKPNGRLL